MEKFNHYDVNEYIIFFFIKKSLYIQDKYNSYDGISYLQVGHNNLISIQLFKQLI